MSNLINSWAKVLAKKNKGLAINQIFKQRLMTSVAFVLFYAVLNIIIALLWPNDLFSTLLFVILLLVLFTVNSLYFLSMDYILLENIDFKNFYDHLEKVKKMKFSTEASRLKNTLEFAYAYFLEGKFSQADDVLTHLNMDQCSKRTQQMYRPIYRYYSFLITVFGFPERGVEGFLLASTVSTEGNKEISNRLDKKMKAIYDVVCLKQVNTYFDQEVPPGSSKVHELEFNYFQSLNYRNSDNLVKTRDIYSKLVTENDHLFMVREAKQYLDIGHRE